MRRSAGVRDVLCVGPTDRPGLHKSPANSGLLRNRGEGLIYKPWSLYPSVTQKTACGADLVFSLAHF